MRKGKVSGEQCSVHLLIQPIISVAGCQVKYGVRSVLIFFVRKSRCYAYQNSSFFRSESRSLADGQNEPNFGVWFGMLFAGDRGSCCDEAAVVFEGNSLVAVASIAPERTQFQPDEFLRKLVHFIEFTMLEDCRLIEYSKSL